MSRPVFFEMPKQPGEDIIVPGFDFTDQLQGETISSADVDMFERATGIDRTSEMIPAGSVQVDGANVSFRIKNGDHNLDYYAEVVATTSGGRELQGVVIIGVRDRPY